MDLNLANQTAGFMPLISSLVLYPGCPLFVWSKGLTVTQEAHSHIHSPSDAWYQETIYVFIWINV